MPETSRKKDTTDTGSTEEAYADALAQSWALSRPARDLWTTIERELTSPMSHPETATGGSRGIVPPKPPVGISCSTPGGDALPPELAGVLALWENGKTVTEIAAELELTEATVKVRIHRARLKVRQAFEQFAAEHSEEEYPSTDAFLKVWETLKEGSLNPSDERRLAECVELGGDEGKRAREILVNANLRLVTSIAKKYQNRGIAMEDLIQEGTLGLIHAVDKYDWRRGFRFSTYATHWIQQALGRAVEEREQASIAPQAENPLQEILAELKALREEVGALRREVSQLRRNEQRPEFGAMLLPYLSADDRGLPLS